MSLTRARGAAEFEVDLELGRSLRRERKKLQASLEAETANMAEGNPPRPRLFGDCYIPKMIEFVEPENELAGYQVPPALINLIQNTAMFHGLDNEDPNLHLQTFMEHCGLLKCPGMPFSQLRRIMFPFSLGGRAREWYQSNGRNIRTYEELTNKFVTKFFPPSKMDKLRNEVYNFKQMTGESFLECWDRFQNMVQKCPNLMVEQGYEIQIFYNGLQPEAKFMVNVSGGGSLKDKTYEEVRDLFKKIAENGCHSGSERAAYSKKNQGLLEVNATQRLEGQMAQVLKVLGEIKAERQSCKVTKVSCGLCQNSHHNDQRPQGAWNDQGSCNNQGNYNWNKPPTSSGSQQNSDLQGGFGEQGNKGNDDNSILTRMNEMEKMMNDLMVSQLQERDLRMQEIRRVEKMMEQCHAIQLRGGEVVSNQEERKEVQSSTDETKENQMVELLCAKIQKLEDVIKKQETQLINISEKLVRERIRRRKKAKKGSVEQNTNKVEVDHIEIPESENGLNAAKTKRRRRRRSKKVIKSQDTNKEQTLQLEQNSSNEELQGTTAQTEICEQFEGSGEEFRDEYSGLNNDAKVGIQDPNLENGLLQLLNLPPQFISVLMDEKNPVIKFGGVELRLHKGLTLEVSANNQT